MTFETDKIPICGMNRIKSSQMVPIRFAHVYAHQENRRGVAPCRAQILAGLLINPRLLPVHWLITKLLPTYIAYLYCRTVVQSLWFRSRNALVAILIHDRFIYIVTFDKTIEQKQKIAKSAILLKICINIYRALR